MPPKDIFEACREGDVERVKELLKDKPDLSAKNAHNFTALHCIAMGSNSLSKEVTLEIMQLLLDAGSPLEIIGGGERTPLYLLAEFTPYIEPVQLLLAAGANPDVRSTHNVHVVENAMMEDVQQLLSELTGVPVPAEPEPGPPSVKMSSAALKKAKAEIDLVFKKLADAGLIVLQNAGTTQSDGFSDCAEVYHDRNDKTNIIGFCFYTGQDQSRAKRSSELPIAFWAAPEGKETDMVRVGTLVVKTFTDAGFQVIWDGSGGSRPSVFLHRFSE
jgi:ankyrin repeat protein